MISKSRQNYAGNLHRLAVLLILWALSSGLSADERIVMVTHPDNTQNITQEDLYRLYFGKLRTLPNGQRLIAIVNKNDDDQLKRFTSSILKRSAQQLRSYWARQLFTGKGKPPLQVEGAEAIKKLIANNPEYVGYLWETEVDTSVKVLIVAGT